MRGIDKFGSAAGHDGEYVLIGGGAWTCCSARPGRISGATKDLDLVLW